MMRQPWQRVYVKDTDKGPMVWEVKHAPFWLSRDGSIFGPYWLIYARNVLDPAELKYFLSNASSGFPGVDRPCGICTVAGRAYLGGREG